MSINHSMTSKRIDDVDGHEGHDVRDHNGMYTVCHDCQEVLGYAETDYTTEKRTESDQ